MKTSRFFVAIFSLALTCFLIGALLAGLFVRRSLQQQILEAELSQPPAPRAASPQRPPMLVRVIPAKREAINTIRPFYGKLAEVQIAKISAEISGLVVDLPIEVGYRVKGGETLIAQIDKTWLELVAAAAEAEVKILERQYLYHVAELNRLEKAAGALTESDLDNQRMLTEQHKQNLEKARIAHQEAKEKLRRTTIIAPFDGYVIRRSVGLGELLAPGSPIAEIVSLGTINAVVNIAEEFINHVEIGEEMPIIIDQLGIKVIGKVHSIVPYDLHETTRSFPVIVRLDDRSGELKSGMSATALVSISDPKEEIVVAKDALLSRPDGDIVWVAESAKRDDAAETITAIPVPVQVTAENLMTYGVLPETEEGKRLLVAGAKTVIEGAERLTGNQRIRIAELDPEFLENLPPASGHRVLKQRERMK